MIPDFKTYIEESTWNDIRKQSSGVKTRIEDDINRFGPEELTGYLESNYSASMFDIEYDRHNNMVTVPILVKGLSAALLCLELGDPLEVSVGCSIRKDFPGMYNKLYGKFNVIKKKKQGESGLYIYPLDSGEVNNKFYIEVLDFIISTGHKRLIVEKI